MSYFDDMEDRRSPLLYKKNPKIHFTNETFRENVDGRFEIRKTLCGLEFSQSSGRLTRKMKNVTCKKCNEIKY